MPWLGFIWLGIFLVRLLTSSGRGAIFRPIAAISGWLQRRGKVPGHVGPDARSFKGRAGRGEWWIALFWNATIAGILSSIPTIGVVLSLPWMIAGLAATSRRLHDLKQSGWLQLVPMVIAAVSLGAGVLCRQLGWVDQTRLEWSSNPTEMMVVGLFIIAALSYLVFYAWMGFARGSRGPNCYGEADPA